MNKIIYGKNYETLNFKKSDYENFNDNFVEIFGVGFLVYYELPHNCDCECCNILWDNYEKIFSKEENANKFIDEMNRTNNSFLLVDKEEVFYRKLITQEKLDFGLFKDEI